MPICQSDVWMNFTCCFAPRLPEVWGIRHPLPTHAVIDFDVHHSIGMGVKQGRVAQPREEIH